MTEDPELDVKTILEDGTEVVLAGRRCVMRRLDVRAVYRLARLVAQSIALAQVSPEALRTAEGQALAIYAALTALEDGAIEYLAWMFGLEPDEFASLPAVAAVDAAEAFMSHPDVREFVGRVAGLVGKLTTTTSSPSR